MKEVNLADLQALVAKLEQERDSAKALVKELRRKRSNVNGGSKEIDRGTWCTPKDWAERVGPWDLDAFSNPRSQIVAETACMLERGDDGLAGPRRGEYFVSPQHGREAILVPGEQPRLPTAGGRKRATVDTRFWGQPPYELVDKALEHYGHTRFCFLLRFDPSTQWFIKLYRLARLVCVPRGKRIQFEPPPGVKASNNPYPHALYYAREEDATPAVLRACIAWRTNSGHER